LAVNDAGFFHSRLLGSTAWVALVIACSILPAAALAQDAAAAGDQAGATANDPGAPLPANVTTPQAASGQSGPGDIVVTGSRVISNGFSAPSPVTVVTGQQLLTTTPTTLGEALNKLPQFANSLRPSTSQIAPESGAASTLNLRSLGAQRGLILLDGRRVNPSTAGGIVDISILPEELVQRVDIVTGGASAAYGSDAIAGVVNFVLDTRFEGLKGSARAASPNVATTTITSSRSPAARTLATICMSWSAAATISRKASRTTATATGSGRARRSSSPGRRRPGSGRATSRRRRWPQAA
jgi:outer membrane cobalamin receptor